MNEFLWINLNWSPIVLIIALFIGGVIFVLSRVLGMLVLALVLYLGTYWQTWDWVVWSFWITWSVGLLVLLMYLINGKGLKLARLGSTIALVTAVVLALSTLPSAFGQWNINSRVNAMAAALEQQLEATDNRINDLEESLDDSDTVQDEINESVEDRLTALEANDATQDRRLDIVEESIAELDGRVDSLEGGVNLTPSPADVPVDDIAEGLAESFVVLGFDPDDIVIGTVDWDTNPLDTGTRTFGERIESRQELKERINSSSDESQALREHLLAAGRPVSEHERLLSGEAHVPVQFTLDTCYEGNTYYWNGTAQRGGTTCREAGDIVWVYVAPNGTPAWDASVRADCSNPGYTKPPTTQQPKAQEVIESPEIREKIVEIRERVVREHIVDRKVVEKIVEREVTKLVEREKIVIVEREKIVKEIVKIICDKDEPTAEPSVETSATPTTAPSDTPSVVPSATTSPSSSSSPTASETAEPEIQVCRNETVISIPERDRRPSDTNVNNAGNCVKMPATQPTGVESPADNPVGQPSASPTAHPSPLTPDATATATSSPTSSATAPDTLPVEPSEIASTSPNEGGDATVGTDTGRP